MSRLLIQARKGGAPSATNDIPNEDFGHPHDFGVGSIIEQCCHWNTITHTFSAGAEKEYKNNRWKVNKISNNAIMIRLVRGTYMGMRSKILVLSDSPEYRHFAQPVSPITQIYIEWRKALPRKRRKSA